MIVDFINPLRFQNASNLLPAALLAAKASAALQGRLRSRGVPCVYANENYGAWRSDFKELVQACRALPGARGAIAELMAPQRGDLTLLKPLHSAFHGTALAHILRQMGARRIVLCGLAADLCVSLTASDAWMRGYEVWVPADCTAAESTARKQAALNHLSRSLGCSIRRSC